MGSGGMTAKRACGCESPSVDPREKSLEVVWHDPTKYDPILHGPPYLPTRLAADSKAVARRVASQNIHPKVARRLMGGVAPLSAVLSTLRAASFLHQTHHWQTGGPSYFADHLMFDRLYTESQSFIDQVAERAVGLGGVEFVDAVSQSRRMTALIEVITRSGGPGADQLVQTSLKMESLVLAIIDEAIALLEDSDSLTAGTDNLLQGVADLHETFVYLLQQRSARSGPHDYAR